MGITDVSNHAVNTTLVGTYLADVQPVTDLHSTLYYCIALLLSFFTNAIVTFLKDVLKSIMRKRALKRKQHKK